MDSKVSQGNVQNKRFLKSANKKFELYLALKLHCFFYEIRKNVAIFWCVLVQFSLSNCSKRKKKMIKLLLYIFRNCSQFSSRFLSSILGQFQDSFRSFFYQYFFVHNFQLWRKYLQQKLQAFLDLIFASFHFAKGKKKREKKSKHLRHHCGHWDLHLCH